MMWVLAIMWGAFTGSICGWIMYNTLADAGKDRLRGAILWGI